MKKKYDINLLGFKNQFQCFKIQNYEINQLIASMNSYIFWLYAVILYLQILWAYNNFITYHLLIKKWLKYLIKNSAIL